VRPSVGSVGDAYDNAMAESFSTLECELLARRRFSSQAEARMAVFSYIEGFYAPLRRHSALGYRSPVVYVGIGVEKGTWRTLVAVGVTQRRSAALRADRAWPDRTSVASRA
jgi:hypothetical protein